MSEEAASASLSAGALLSRAREAKGLSLDHLASLLKIPEAKLAALEADRHEELPGRAFVRALAMSVCRQLEIDTQPVLDLLPPLSGPSAELEHVTRGLATPFHATDARILPGLPANLPQWLRPGVVAPAFLLLLALGFWLAPGVRLWSGTSLVPSPKEAASAAEFSVSTVGLASGALAASAPPAGVGAVGGLTAGAVGVESASTVSGANKPASVAGLGLSAAASSALSGGGLVATGAAAGLPASGATGAGALVITSTKGSWMEVRDSRAVLLSRTVAAGEVVPLDGVAPFKIKIGNAVGVSLTYQGQPVDVAAATKDNIARLEIK